MRDFRILRCPWWLLVRGFGWMPDAPCMTVGHARTYLLYYTSHGTWIEMSELLSLHPMLTGHNLGNRQGIQRGEKRHQLAQVHSYPPLFTLP